MRKAAVTAAKLAIGAAIILYLTYFVGIGKIYTALIGMNWLYLPAIVLIFVISVAMRALNFRVLLLPHEQFRQKATSIGHKPIKGQKISLGKLAWISIASWAAGMFTPGKLGEFSSILLLKKEGLETGTSAAVSLLNKILTSITIIAFAIVGLVKFLGIGEAAQLTAVFVIITLLPYVAFTNKRTREIIKRVFGKMLNKYEQQFAGFADELDAYLARRKKLLLYSLALNIAWVAVSSWLFVLAFAAVGQQVGFIDVMLINSIGTTTSFIPLTIGGTGLREASALAFFSKLGISNATILASHLIIAAVSYTLAGLTALLFLARKNR